MPIICASWNSLDLMKFLPRVAVTLVMTEVLSFSMVWYLGSGRSPMKRRMVIHRARAASCREGSARKANIKNRRKFY